MSAPGYTIADTAITVGSTSNWSTDTGVVFAIDEAQVVDGQEIQVAGTYNEYIGVVSSGTSVTSVAWQTGVGDRNYASGALTRVYIPVSAERENRIVEWGTVEHKQDGTHAAVTATSLTATAGLTITGGAVSLPAGSIETADLAAGSVTNAKLISTIFSGQVSSYTNTGTGAGTGYYINLGGIKLCWGTSGSFTSTTNTSYTTSLPASFFTTIQHHNVYVAASSAPISYVGVTATTSLITTFFATAATSNTISWFVIGT